MLGHPNTSPGPGVDQVVAGPARSVAGRWRSGWPITPGFVIDALYTDDSAEAVCARNVRVVFDSPLSAEIPTVEWLVEHADGGDETWVKENGVVVYPQVPAGRPEP